MTAVFRIAALCVMAMGSLLTAQSIDAIAQHAKSKPLTPSHLDTLENLPDNDPNRRKAFELLVGHYYGLQNWGALIRLYNNLASPTAADKLTHAKLLIRNGKFKAATALLKPMADAQPEHEEYNRLTGHALFYSSDPQTAAPYLERVVEASVKTARPDPLYMRGMLYFYTGDYDQAVAHFKRVRTFAPEHVPTLNSLGRTLSAAGKRDEAQGFLQQAARLQAEQTASEKQNLRIGARLRQLEQAWRTQDFITCENLIGQLLPQANADLKGKLNNMLIAIYDATGRSQEASALRAKQ